MKTKRAKNSRQLNAVEMGKLWATYMGNSMSECVLRYYLQHVEDRDIRSVLDEALKLSRQFTRDIYDVFTRENVSIPKGFNDEDVNLGAPRLFRDEFYLHYLKYVGKAGMSLYGIAVPLVVRRDIREFFTNAMASTMKLMNDINEVLEAKGFLVEPPDIPVPQKVDFVNRKHYLNGFFGNVRPLQGLEITHLYDNVQNNATSKAVLIGFSQVAKQEKVRNYFMRGKELESRHVEAFSKVLHENDLPSHPLLDHLVTDSTYSPFSDKIMVFHQLDMFSMRIRTYGNSIAVSARNDLATLIGRCMLDVGNYVKDGSKIMIDNGWMEQPPQAVDRKQLILK